jgi:hypothetical protein
VSSRNGSPAGSSGLLGIPRENSVSGADITCDGGSILNGKKTIYFHCWFLKENNFSLFSVFHWLLVEKFVDQALLPLLTYMLLKLL